MCFGVWIGNWVLYIQIQYTKCMLFFYRIDNPSPNKIVFYLGSFLSVSFKILQSPGYIPGENYNLKGCMHLSVHCFIRASQVAQMVKNLPTVWKTRVWSLGWEDPLEKEMATLSNILAYSCPWGQSPLTEEPGRLPYLGSQIFGHDWATKHSSVHCSTVYNIQNTEAT